MEPVFGFSEDKARKLNDLLSLQSQIAPSNRQVRYPVARIAIAQAPSGGISARSGSAPGSASCGFYELSAGSLVSSSITETVYNIFSSAIANNAYIIVAQDYIGGDWYVISEDCV